MAGSDEETVEFRIATHRKLAGDTPSASSPTTRTCPPARSARSNRPSDSRPTASSTPSPARSQFRWKNSRVSPIGAGRATPKSTRRSPGSGGCPFLDLYQDGAHLAGGDRT
jgi:hypothetical protein